tara:strand:+ start:1536 stop:1820 length:285 start_codon:yes stop_codon:yes gene_type:complete
MKQEFTAKALKRLRNDLESQHGVVLGDVQKHEKTADHTVHNVLQAHICYRAVIDRVLVDVEGNRPCNPTDLELLEIRKTYYRRQVADFYRSHPK